MKIVNTRPADRGAGLSRLLRQADFEPVEIPFVDVRADEEGVAKVAALQPNGFTGIFLSSPNGLRHMQDGLLPSQFERWAAKPFYLVGPAARPLVEAAGGRVAFAPEEASLEGFLKEYVPARGPGLTLAQRWLHPCSASTRLDPAEFKKKGLSVVNMPVYRPACPADLAARMAKEGEGAAAILFCSGSAVENFFQAAPALAQALTRPRGPGGTSAPGGTAGPLRPLAVSIGPSTTKALKARGVEEVIQALHADDASLVDALKAACGGTKTEVLKAPPAAPKPATAPANAPAAAANATAAKADVPKAAVAAEPPKKPEPEA